jgi:hypothetical protein
MPLLTFGSSIILMMFTMHSEVLHKIQVVQAYIYHKTGKQVRIVFNRPDRMAEHLQLLDRAYQVAMSDFRTKS